MTRDAGKKTIDFQKLVPSVVQWKEEEEGKKEYPHAHTHGEDRSYTTFSPLGKKV